MKSMDRCLTFSTAYELLRVPSDTVVYIEADGNYSTLHLANGESSVVSMQLGQIVYLIMNTVEPGDERFVRIDRNLIINCDYVFDIQVNKQKLPLSHFCTRAAQHSPFYRKCGANWRIWA